MDQNILKILRDKIAPVRVAFQRIQNHIKEIAAPGLAPNLIQEDILDVAYLLSMVETIITKENSGTYGTQVLEEIINKVKSMTSTEYEDLYKKTAGMDQVHVVLPEDIFIKLLIRNLAKSISEVSCQKIQNNRVKCEDYGIYKRFGSKIPDLVIPKCAGYPPGSDACIILRIKTAQEMVNFELDQ